MRHLLAAAIMALSSTIALADEQPTQPTPTQEQVAPKPPEPVTIIRGTTVEQVDPRTPQGQVTILRGK